MQNLFTAGSGVRFSAAVAVVIGSTWLLFWFAGIAPRWSAEGVLTVKANMALSQVLAGAALLLLAALTVGRHGQRAGLLCAGTVFLIGALTLSEHLFNYNLGIDQLLASEVSGAVGTVSPNRIGPPGSLSLTLLGAGLLTLRSRWRSFAPWLGLAACIITLIPAVGFIYGIAEFYSHPRLTGIAWSSVIALFTLGTGLLLACPAQGPVAQLLRDDPGGALLRRLWPAAVLIPLGLGFVKMVAQGQSLFNTGARTGMLVIAVVVAFSVLLWMSAAHLSRVAGAQAQAEGERRSAALFPQENPAPVLRVDTDGRLLFANRASATLLAEWRGAVGALTPDFLQRSVKKVLEVGGETELEVEAGGRTFSLMLVPIRGRNYLNLYGRDVTERKRAEEALRESEKRYRSLFESIDEGFSVIDVIFDQEDRPVDYRFMELNPAFEKQTGLVNASGKCIRALAPEHEQYWFDMFGQVAKSGQPVRFENAAKALGRYYDVYAFRVGPPEGRRVAVLFNDITERKRAEAVLMHSKEELERLVAERTARLQELIGELEHFSYTITHDLRAPLRAMKGFGELLSDLCEGGEHEERRQFIRRILTSAERMDALIRDALNYSRTVRQELPLDNVDTGALLRGMLDSYPEFQATRARIAIEGALPVVLANEAGLTQCFSNLLGNAVKFVKPGEMPEIRVWAEQREGWARLWVEDKGIGISKEMLPRVFDMFSRGHSGYEGTGIGLALVRKVTHRMGGRAGVESEEGKGSRFWVELTALERKANTGERG